MNYSICCKSIVTPGHNELLPIWFQIIVVLYFWINVILDLCQVGIYGTIETSSATAIILLMNVIFAVQATITLFYLIFYSLGHKKKRILEIFHYSAILCLITYLAFIIVFYEFKNSEYKNTFYFFLAIGLVSAIVLLIIIDLKMSQYLAFTIIGGLALIVLAMDYTNYASHRMFKLYYQPLFFESLLILFALILFGFRIPERCCPNTRWPHLYLSSQIILIIFMLNFLYSIHGVYIRTIKLEEGSLSKSD